MLSSSQPPAEPQTPPPGGFFCRNLVSPSPDNNALMRSIGIPVDKYTGVANIEVPVTDIQVGNNSIPVVLSYQASGIKVQDVASTVGLGWRLSAGGRISREVRGWADNLADFSNRTKMQDKSHWFLTTNWLRDHFDTEPDLFYFEYPGGGGTFAFDEQGIPHPIPGQDIRIEYTGRQFVLTDAGGTEYLYATCETTQYTLRGGPNESPVTESYISTWFLDHIRYADGSLVVFNYEQGDSYTFTNTGSQSDVSCSAHSDTIVAINTVTTEASIEVQKPKYLAAIRYKNNFVGFTYDAERTDIRGLRKLTWITTSYANRNPRKYQLSYGQFANGNLKLFSLYDRSISAEALNICLFDYYDTINLPSRNSSETDHWGYYNGPRSDGKAYPETNIRSELTGNMIHIAGASKKPALLYAQANSIRKINYPTGGSKTFEYELHRGVNPTTGYQEDAGGLRIKKITETTVSNTSTRSYTYSGGVIYADTVNYCLYSLFGDGIDGFHYRLSSQHINEITDMNGCSVIYSSVTEQLPNGARTEYEYAPYGSIPDEAGALYDSFSDDPLYLGPDTLCMGPKTSRHWLRNLLRSETQYDAQGEVTSSVDYEYVRLDSLRRIYSLNYFAHQYIYRDELILIQLFPSSRISEYYLESQPVVLSKTTTTQGRYNLGSTTKFEYHGSSSQPTQIIRTDSLGGETKVTVKYPGDYPAISLLEGHAQALAAMRDKNMLATPVETVTWKNGRVIGAELNLYLVTNGVPMLSEIRKYFCDPNTNLTEFPESYIDSAGNFVTDSGYETTWQAKAYDSDNTLLSSSDKGGRQTSVLYGYRNTLPVAVVQNARHAADGTVLRKAEQILSGNQGKSNLTLTRPQVVDFHTTLSEQGRGRELEVIIEGGTWPANGTFLQHYYHPEDNVVKFTADLPAGDFTIQYRWTASAEPTYPDVETRAEIDIYQPSLHSGDRVFHTSFEEEAIKHVYLYPSDRQYLKMPSAKSGEWVRIAPYEMHFPASVFDPRDSLELTYWEYHKLMPTPSWEMVRRIIPKGTSYLSLTIQASDSVFIDEVRVQPLGALMTTYAYRPGIGKLSETDPSGITNHYRYDDAGRLIAVVDTEGQMIKRYTYENYNKIIEETINGKAEFQTRVLHLDGLGRREQAIDVGATPSRGDIVQFWSYDEMGRGDATSYMPYAYNTNLGSKRTNPLAESRTCYQSSPDAERLANPFTRKFYDSSPQGATLKTSVPHIGITREEKYETSFGYGFNTGADSIRQYTLSQDTVIVWLADHAPGTLRKVETRRHLTDTEEGIVREFYDNDEHLVMREAVTSATTSERTYYLYDDFGRQRVIIPAPANGLFAAKGSTPACKELQKYCYFSVYDCYGRVGRQSTPGAGWEYRLYDHRDRLVMTQTTGMQAENRWLFTRYDLLDRPVLTGTYTGGDYSAHQAALAAKTPYYPALQSAGNLLTQYYYDNYDWQSDKMRHCYASYTCKQRRNIEGIPTTGEVQTRQKPSVRGMATGRRCKVLGIDEDIWLTTTQFYDASGRLTQTTSDLWPRIEQSYERVINDLDAVGNVTSVYVCQKGELTFKPTGYLKEMTYDHRDRLKTTRFLTFYDPTGGKVRPEPGYVNGYDYKNDKVIVAAYEYDELGRIRSKAIHNGLETTTYNYDMNHLLSASAPSFSYTLGYDNPTMSLSEARYDGGICEASWKRGAGKSNGYIFSFDALGQMTAARYITQAAGGWQMDRKFWETASYGSGGVIDRITRHDVNGYASTIQQRYDGYRVADMTAGTTTAQFTYDLDGNLTFDGNLQAEIQYNILNLPRKIIADSHEINYIYTSDGQKIASAIDGSFTYYRNTLIYEGASKIPAKIFHPEGFVDFATDTYKYFKKDHLGNIRVLLAVDGYSYDAQQSLVVEQNTDFYPFGLAHGQYQNLHLNRFLFSGKELQDSPNTNNEMLAWYDFGFRHYNPLLGHWMTPDPLAQFENPYLYCMNDPANCVDPNGLWGLFPGGSYLDDGTIGIDPVVVYGRLPKRGYNLNPSNIRRYSKYLDNLYFGEFIGGGGGYRGNDSDGELPHDSSQNQLRSQSSRFQLVPNPIVQAIYRGQKRFWGTTVDLGFYAMDKMSTGVTALGVITAPIGIGGPLMATGGVMGFASGWYNGLQAINAGNTYLGAYQIGMSTFYGGMSWGLSRFMTLNQSAFFELYLAPFSYITNQTSNNVHY